jgi:hypothetical protein
MTTPRKIFLRDRLAFWLVSFAVNHVAKPYYRAYLRVTLDLGMEEIGKKLEMWEDEDKEN